MHARQFTHRRKYQSSLESANPSERRLLENFSRAAVRAPDYEIFVRLWAAGSPLSPILRPTPTPAFTSGEGRREGLTA